MFDIDRTFNSQHNRICAVNHSVANTKGGPPAKTKVSTKGYDLRLGVCSKGVDSLW